MGSDFAIITNQATGRSTPSISFSNLTVICISTSLNHNMYHKCEMLYQIPHTCRYNSSNEHMRYIKYKSHPPPKYAWCFSHPPLSVESPASRRKMRMLREAVLARGDRQYLYDKLAISNTYSHAKNRNDLRPITLSKVPFPEVGFSAVAILGGGWLQSPASDGPPWWGVHRTWRRDLAMC